MTFKKKTGQDIQNGYVGDVKAGPEHGAQRLDKQHLQLNMTSWNTKNVARGHNPIWEKSTQNRPQQTTLSKAVDLKWKNSHHLPGRKSRIHTEQRKKNSDRCQFWQVFIPDGIGDTDLRYTEKVVWARLAVSAHHMKAQKMLSSGPSSVSAGEPVWLTKMMEGKGREEKRS